MHTSATVNNANYLVPAPQRQIQTIHRMNSTGDGLVETRATGFFDLPGELRNMIYALTLTTTTRIGLDPIARCLIIDTNQPFNTSPTSSRMSPRPISRSRSWPTPTSSSMLEKHVWTAHRWDEAVSRYFLELDSQTVLPRRYHQNHPKDRLATTNRTTPLSSYR